MKLSDVADVGDGASEVRGFARLNGRPVVGFQVTKTKEASDVDAEDAVIAKLAELEKTHPEAKFTQIEVIPRRSSPRSSRRWRRPAPASRRPRTCWPKA